MKNSLILFFGLVVITLLTTGCEEEFSSIDLEVVNETIATGEHVEYRLTMEGSSLIDRYEVVATMGGDEIYRFISTPAAASIGHNDRFFAGNQPGEITLTAVANFSNGDTARDTKTVDVEGQASGNLVLNWQLQYDGAPMVLFTPYSYEDYNITFTRYTTYLSNLQLGDQAPAPDIYYATISDSHADVGGAAAGYDLAIPVSPGTYQGFDIALGVDSIHNASRPSDWASGHPLASSGEYWLSWRSYVFTKIEGTIDTDNDGQSDRSFALHLGGDVAYQTIGTDTPFTITEGQDTRATITLDLKEWFYGVENGPYDLIDNGSIHSTQHIPLIEQLQTTYPDIFNIQL